MRPTKTALDCLSLRVEKLGLSAGTVFRLWADGTDAVRDLVLDTENGLIARGYVERLALEEVKQKLNAIGLRLGMRFRDGILTFGDEP